MIIKRKINVFNVTKKKLEYSQKILDAVLDPRITFNELHINGGYDWIDEKYKFLKLLLSRGQVLKIITHSDLLAENDYLDAIKLGLKNNYSFELVFREGVGQGAFASTKRLDAARIRWSEFVAYNRAA